MVSAWALIQATPGIMLVSRQRQRWVHSFSLIRLWLIPSFQRLVNELKSVNHQAALSAAMEANRSR